MADQIQLPVLLSLLPKVGKMIQAEQDRPPMQQALTAQLMLTALKRERGQIAELRKTQKTLQVRPDDKRGQEQAGQRFESRHRPPEDPGQSIFEAPDNVSGQIVNIKV